MKDEKAVVAHLNDPSFTPSVTALVGETIPGKTEFDSTAVAEIESYTPNTVTIKCECPSRSFLVLADSYYPTGWKATIDGQKQHIYQVNHVARGVIVPEGRHRIVFDFSPDIYYTARTVSTVTIYGVWLVLLAGILVSKKKRLKSLFKKRG